MLLLTFSSRDLIQTVCPHLVLFQIIAPPTSSWPIVFGGVEVSVTCSRDWNSWNVGGSRLSRLLYLLHICCPLLSVSGTTLKLQRI